MLRTRRLVLFVAAALVLTAAAQPTPADAGTLVVVKAPPGPRLELRPLAPGPDHVWVAGHWRWNGHRHVWTAGTWIQRPAPHAVWVNGRWAKRPGGWTWIPGHWRRV